MIQAHRREYKRAWFAARPDYMKQWDAAHPGRRSVYRQRWAEKNPEKQEAYQLNSWRRAGMRKRDRMKADIMMIYGKGAAACVACGIADLDVLTLDHVNNDGAAERKTTGSARTGDQFYRRLKRLGFPPGYQTLCANCNLKKYVRHRRASMKAFKERTQPALEGLA